MQDLGKCTQFLRIYLKDLKEAFQPNKNSIKSMISRGEGRDLWERFFQIIYTPCENKDLPFKEAKIK